MNEKNPFSRPELIKFLKTKYKENPCRTLSTAFWKILKPLEEIKTFQVYESNKIKLIILKDEKKLLLYWQSEDEGENIPISLGKLDFFVIHEQYQKIIPDSVNREEIEKYFRLIHHCKNIPSKNLPDGFHIQDVSIYSELTDTCNFLNLCYPGSHFKESTIKSWTLHPVFNHNLWIWIVDEHGTKAALGIAEIDEDIQELSLEWIQVHPAFRHRGLGKCLIYELLSRRSNNTEFATVSGLKDNKTHPEQLYRSCGFFGHDIWLVYTKDQLS